MGLAGAYQHLGRLGQAERVLTVSLALSRHTSAADAQRLAILNRLGVVLKTAGRYDEAAIRYEHVQSALDTLSVARPDLLAVLRHNLAGLAYARGDYRTAETHIREALALRTRSHAAGSEYVADEGLLGAVLAAQGRRAEACEVLTRVLAEMERLHGADHYEVAVVLQNCAALHQRHDPQLAQQQYERALRIKEHRLGRSHPEVGVLLNNVATLHNQQDRRQRALECCIEARGLLRRAYGPKHPATQACEQNLRRIVGARH